MNRLWTIIRNHASSRFVQMSTNTAKHAGPIETSQTSSSIQVPALADSIQLPVQPLNSSKQSQKIYLRKLLLAATENAEIEVIPGQGMDRKSTFESLRLLKDPNLVTYDIYLA